MSDHTRKSQKKPIRFMSAGVLFVCLSLATGCADIPTGLGLGAAAGLAYYAYTNTYDKEIDQDKEDKIVVEEKVEEANQQTDIREQDIFGSTVVR